MTTLEQLTGYRNILQEAAEKGKKYKTDEVNIFQLAFEAALTNVIKEFSDMVRGQEWNERQKK